MASGEQLILSDFIKSIHQNLRENFKEMGIEQAWQKHCGDKENLKKYADAMKALACQYWDRKSSSTTVSRIHWSVDTSFNYFANDIYKFRDKEKEISVKLNHSFTLTGLYNPPITKKLKLLDVGSCYNPFNKFEYFEVTPIDIAPAVDEVIKCDFLSVKLAETIVIRDKELCELPKGYFDVIVFSLLLEYLPSPSQRLFCCKKAYKLLQNEGLLIIITPDSNHVGINAKYMKSWRYVLAKIGFARIKYEKLPHIHCMAFRKSINKATAYRWAELHKEKQLFEEIYIPQDFNQEQNKKSETSTHDYSSIDRDFSELPEFDVFQ